MDKLKKLEPIFRLIEVFCALFATIFISVRANNIAELQVEMARADTQPEFEINEILCENEEGESNAEAWVKISKLSGKCSNIDINAICFARLCFYNADEFIQENFRLDGFFFANKVIGSVTGELREIGYRNNWKKINDFSQEVLQSSKLEMGYIEPIQFLKISYDDAYGESHTNYYKFDSMYCTEINNVEGENIFKDYYQTDKKLDIDELRIDDLIAQIKIK